MPRTLLRGLLVTVLGVATLAAAHAEPVTVETAIGPAEIAETPEKIAVFDISALDTLQALGVKVDGAPDNVYVDYLSDVIANAEPVGTIFEPDFEAVYALQPDLIITGTRSSKQTEPLSELAPTIDMTVFGTDVVAKARQRIDAYGKIFGKEEEAARLDADLAAEQEKVKATAAKVGNALIVLTNGPKVSVFGVGSRFGWLHSDLGIEPATKDIQPSTHGEAVSFEFIRDVNPDWLLVVDRAAAVSDKAQSAQETLNNDLVAATTAWKKGQVVYLEPARMYISSGGYQALMGTMEELVTAFSGETGNQ